MPSDSFSFLLSLSGILNFYYAPDFFEPLKTGTSFVDGGVWANNPVGPAVVEAIGVLGWEKGEFHVLSIGCTSHPFSVNLGRKLALGKTYWAIKAVETFMSGQSSQSLGTAMLLPGHNFVHRYDILMEKNKFSLDGYKEMKTLKELGETEARKALQYLENIFFREKADPFIPFHHLQKKVV